MMRSRMQWVMSLALVAALGLAMTPQSAHAQSDEELFQNMMKKASDLYNAEDYTAALIAYLEVKSRFGSPVVDYSLGRTYQQLYQCDKAMAFYMIVMNDYDLRDDDKLFEKSANYYNELNSCERWGKVDVTCESPNAQLYIEDKPMGRCMSGIYRMREGKYTFKIEAEGVDAVEIDTRVEDGSSEAISLKLPPVIKEVIKEVPVDTGGQPIDDGPNWLAWGLVGGGVAMLIAGGFTNAAGFSDLRDAQKFADAGDDAGKQDALDSANLNKILTGVFLGVGVAAAGTGLTLAIIDMLDDGSESPEAGDVEVGAGVTGNGGTIFLTTHW